MARLARIARVTTVAVVAATALMPVGAASAAGANASSTDLTAALTLMPGFERVTDSVRLLAPVMLHGRLTDSSGEAMDRATVFLSAWPKNETIAAMPIGQTFSLTPIARVTTGRDGSYELRSALTGALASLVGRDGLDVQLDVFHDGRQHTWLSQVRTSNGIGWVLPTVTDAVQTLTSGAATGLNALDISFNASQAASTAPFRPAHHDPNAEKRRGESGPHPFPGAWCVERKIGEKKAPTIVATTLARQGTSSVVTYGHGAQSKLSAGLSVDAGASFGISGERTRTSDFGGGFAPKPGKQGAPAHTDYVVRMVHAVIAQECVGNTEREIRVRQIRTSPIGPSGGGFPKRSKQAEWNCVERNIEPARFGWVETQNAEAYTFSKGFSYAPNGRGLFTGEAVSGYSDTVKLVYTFKHPGRGGWCGHTAYPTAEGQLTQAFEKRPA